MPDQTVLTGVSQETTKRAYRRRTFKIFHLDRILQDDVSTYGQNIGLIVIAETAQEAREMAADHASEEGAGVWLDHRKSTITEIGTAGKDEQKSRVILIDKHEG